mgnify:CR=1 FL=1
MVAITINGKVYNTNADPRTPLLWVLRDDLGLTGTKYGCGEGQCGACTVLVDGKAVRFEANDWPGADHRDAYGRTLGFLYLANGKMLNSEMVRLGFARLELRFDERDDAPAQAVQEGALLHAPAPRRTDSAASGSATVSGCSWPGWPAASSAARMRSRSGFTSPSR